MCLYACACVCVHVHMCTCVCARVGLCVPTPCPCLLLKVSASPSGAAQPSSHGPQRHLLERTRSAIQTWPEGGLSRPGPSPPPAPSLPTGGGGGCLVTSWESVKKDRGLESWAACIAVQPPELGLDVQWTLPPGLIFPSLIPPSRGSLPGSPPAGTQGCSFPSLKTGD